jgi:hypothetical protein
MTELCREPCPIDQDHGCALAEEHDGLHTCPACKLRWPDGPVLW